MSPLKKIFNHKHCINNFVDNTGINRFHESSILRYSTIIVWANPEEPRNIYVHKRKKQTKEFCIGILIRSSRSYTLNQMVVHHKVLASRAITKRKLGKFPLHLLEVPRKKWENGGGWG